MNELRESVPSEGGDRTYKVVYTIVERGGGKKPVWVRLGAAFENRDKSLTVKLDATPNNGMLHIRDYHPDERWGRRDDAAPFRVGGAG